MSVIHRFTTAERLDDAWDEPDTGKPPCIFCRREIPCECDGETCMCSCGRCLAVDTGE